jgi:hypothetical protein
VIFLKGLQLNGRLIQEFFLQRVDLLLRSRLFFLEKVAEIYLNFQRIYLHEKENENFLN